MVKLSPSGTLRAVEPDSHRKQMMAGSPESEITFQFTTPILTEILTGERLAPIKLSVEGLDLDDTEEVLESGNFSVMASLMSADGRVPMSLVDPNIFGGRTFSSPSRRDDQVLFKFDDLVIRQSGNFRIQFALIKRKEGDEQEGTVADAPMVPLSRHTEVLHVSAFVHGRRGEQGSPFS